MNVHFLKTDSGVFQQVAKGWKTFEIRKNDRDYQTLDLLILRETKYTGDAMRVDDDLFPLVYTGNTVVCKVTHVMMGPIYGLVEGWCIMSIKVLQ